MTTIIELFGGPGTGKSTSAAFLYYALKSAGHNAELVREYVKDWAWEGRKIDTYDQLYFMGKQVRRESMLYGKVDWIVTDSPILMGAYYAGTCCPLQLSEGIRSSTLAFYRQAEDDGHRHVHVMLSRTKPYVAAGRYQSEEDARKIDEEILRFLRDLRFPVTRCGTKNDDLTALLDELTGTVR